MSVIVRGMEMPESCTECPFQSYSYHTGMTMCMAKLKVMPSWKKVAQWAERPKWCPLFECKSMDQT